MPSFCSLIYDDKKGGKHMTTFISTLKSSAREIRKISTITGAALLTAMNTVLGYFTIMVGNFLKIGFSYLTLAVAGFLYGPVIGGILGGLSDILNYVIKPTGPFFPGFTFNAILSGFIYGLILYKKPVSLLRVFLTKLLLVIIVDLILTTTWLSILYGEAFIVLLPMRALKNLIMLPIDTTFIYFIISRLTKILKTEIKHQ
jgi:ECF transporter S component (folate family)